MGRNPFTARIDLYGCTGCPDGHLLSNIVVRYRVKHCVVVDMVVVLYRSLLYFRHFKSVCRKRNQVRLLFQKERAPRSIPLGKGPVIEFLQFLVNCPVQFLQGIELGMPQCRSNPCRDNSYGSLSGRFVFRFPDAGWDDNRSVMLRHFPVDAVNLL